MIKRIKNMKQDEVRLIKISREALFEFIYEKFIESQDDYLRNCHKINHTFGRMI